MSNAGENSTAAAAVCGGSFFASLTSVMEGSFEPRTL